MCGSGKQRLGQGDLEMSQSSNTSNLGTLTALAIFASYHHSERSVRHRLKTKLSDWIQSCEPHNDREDIKAALLSVSGTVLEPFRLTSEDIEIATDLVQAAFSNVHRKTRVRIVSRDTLGTSGGCVLTSNLASYYVERFPHGKRTRTPKNPWFFAPSMAPDRPISGTTSPSKIKASCHVTSSGYTIRITGFPYSEFVDQASGQGPDLISRLTKHLRNKSTIGKEAVSLDDLGCRVDMGRNRIDIVTTSPEAMVRLTANMSRNEVLTLHYSDLTNPPSIFFLWLRPPKTKKTELKIIATADEKRLQDWIGLQTSTVPTLDQNDIYDISKWHAPHRQWVSAALIENLQ